MQSALAKERREQKHAARMAEMDCIPTGLHKNWIDPMPDCKNPEPLRLRDRTKPGRNEFKPKAQFCVGVSNGEAAAPPSGRLLTAGEARQLPGSSPAAYKVPGFLPWLVTA